jgi:hypothetical protein
MDVLHSLQRMLHARHTVQTPPAPTWMGVGGVGAITGGWVANTTGL